MEKTISQRVAYIKKIRDIHGLSAEKISDIVSRHGEYVSITTIRRVIAKNAETRRFRIDTVAPIYDSLLAEYGDDTPSKPCAFNFKDFDREKYEHLILSLKDQNDRLHAKNEQQSRKIEQQNKIIEILWHGLQTFGRSSEEYAKIIDYYIKNRKE